jgi:hypothetical protein
MANEKNGAAQAKERALRSKRLYWVIGTLIVAAVLFTVYYSVYVSAQQTYYNQRAFRLLSSLSDKFGLQVQMAGNVLKASTSFSDQNQASDYVHLALHGKLEERDFTITGWHKTHPDAQPGRKAMVSFFAPNSPTNFSVRAEYHEGAVVQSADKKNVAAAVSSNPCTNTLTEITICASVNFDPLIRPAFDSLDEGFFDDLLVADSDGNVLYQDSQKEMRIENLNSLTSASDNLGIGNLLFKSNKDSSAGSTARTFSSLTQASGLVNVQLAGSDYNLYFQPLSVTLRHDDQDIRLVLCGLRTVKHTRSQALAVPYNYLLWSILLLLTVFAVGWPLLKFHYINPKERFRPRQILYLLASILLATALVTLIALNASYEFMSDNTSQAELHLLADRINRNFSDELCRALNTLNHFTSDQSLLKLASDAKGPEGNEAKFLSQHQHFFDGPHAPYPDLPPYPYFRFFFLAGADGWQKLKFTVGSETTPWTNVRTEPFFHPVIDNELSEFDLRGSHHQMMMTPVFSPNTGEFLVVLAEPWSGTAPEKLRKMDPRVEVLAIKVESLYKPILPGGYGYAIVDSDGKVLFHSSAVRNLNEDLFKEAQSDISLQALLAEGSTGYVTVRYLGTDKKMWVTPLMATLHPRLTLVVFKDASNTTTMNMIVVVVFGVLVMCYAIAPLLIVVGIHVVRGEEYPLEIIWPNCDRRPGYIHIAIVNGFLAAAFFQRYVTYDLQRTLFTVLAVALVAALYPLVKFCWKVPSLANWLVVAALILTIGWNWWLVLAAIFAAYALFAPSTHVASSETKLLRGLSLNITYTLAVVSFLVILVVVPGVGFFKVSYDFVNRLFIQSQQLELAERLEQRREAIEDYYSHLGAPKSFKDLREAENLDRYDRLFFNCSMNAPSLHDADSSGLAERGILYLTKHFPVNPFAAQLRELARTRQDVPGVKWRIADRKVPCDPHLMTRKSLWLETAGGPIVSPIPIWPAFDWHVRLFLSFAMLGLGIWIHFVYRPLFLLTFADLPVLERWLPPSDGKPYDPPQHILLIGHPKSGKRTIASKLKPSQVHDFAEMATTGNWKIPSHCPKLMVLHHFEFGIDNAEINMKKLCFLEQLIHVLHKKVILLSTIDPLYYLNAGCPDIVVSGEKKTIAAGVETLDRWASVLSGFRKVGITDITLGGFRNVVLSMRKKRPEEEFQRFIRHVVDECDHTAQLRKMGAAILRTFRKSSGLTKEQVLEQLLDRADSYYRVLWSTCTQNERLVLYQLAKDGWANPKNELAIQQLERRGLVLIPSHVCDGKSWACDNESAFPKEIFGMRIMNESFRRFIRNSQQRDEIEAWEKEGEQSVWRFLKLSLGILAVALGAWLLYSQQQFFNTVVAYVGALGAAAGVVFKLLGDLRGKAGASSQGT